MSSTPTGTVTFLFTDIEGSTRLWEQHPDAMRPALARHDDLLRQSIEARGGFVFKTVGDAFCAAFPTAPAALAAALDAQTALAAEGWPDVLALRARMALHAGAAEERGGDYFGPPLNRAARLLAAGHGGQVLLSDVVQELTYDALPADASLRGLGEHRLKDLGRPEQVFQLLHPSVPADFPPLRSLDSPDLPNNLPQQPTSFVGREREIAEVQGLMDGTRLLTLTGTGGCGKTRLSLQVAADLLERFPDGVWLAELAALADPALVPQAVAQAVGVPEAAGQPVARVLVDGLRGKRLLLVLDNCEHLVAACASLAADLLRNCPGVHLLATSREPLGVAGEQTYRVPSLSSPDPGRRQSAEALSQYEAVRLFIQRAQAAQPAFAVTDANAPAVAQVCFHLDGIPLAIELAAARVRAMPVEQVMARLDQRFRLLTGGSRTVLPRQQTLRALIDWSYDLLTGPEQALLGRLSVFAGGWTLEAAEAVCAGDPVEDWEVLDLLTALVDKSLVAYDQPEGGGGRYRLLETVRQYAAERLEAEGATGAARDRHLAHFAGLAWEGHERRVRRGGAHPDWERALAPDLDNLRAALAWGLAGGDAEAGLRLASALSLTENILPDAVERQAYLDGALRHSVERPSAERAWALMRAGVADQGGSVAYLERAVAMYRQIGDAWGLGSALQNLALVLAHSGDAGRPPSLMEEALPLLRAQDDRTEYGWALVTYWHVRMWRGAEARDLAAESALLDEALAVFTQEGNAYGQCVALQGQAGVAQYGGDMAAAQSLLGRARACADQAGWVKKRVVVLYSLADADADARAGDAAAARAHAAECLDLLAGAPGWSLDVSIASAVCGEVLLAVGDHAAAECLFEDVLSQARGRPEAVSLTGWAIKGLGFVALAAGERGRAADLFREAINKPGAVVAALLGLAAALDDRARSARLLGAYERVLEDQRIPAVMVSPAWAAVLGTARAAFPPGEFEAERAEGRAMTWEQAVEYALAAGEP